MKLDLPALKDKFRKARLIVTDIDGTLLNSEGRPGALTSEMTAGLAARNVMFTLATQRVHSSAARVAKSLNITIPLIASNGALIQNTEGKCIHKSAISPKKVLKAIELAEKNYVKVVLCYNDVIVYTDENSMIKDYMNRFGTTYLPVSSYKDYTDNVLEIIMSGNDKNKIKMIKRKMDFPFKLFLKTRYFRSNSHNKVYNLEIIKKGTSKRTGLDILAKHLKVKKDEVIVFGDWYNDRDLFNFGGTNVALQNAVPELKNRANYITEFSNEEDGIGRLLKLVYD